MKAVIFFMFVIYLKECSGHGMMLDPPNRSSLWRFYPAAPHNYNDNQNFCGGAWVQNGVNGGRCGVCGDTYTDKHPQANENTGIYGRGIVVAQYESGSVIDVKIVLTANHVGSFRYYLCVLEDPNAPESGEDCFIQLPLEDGSWQYNVSIEDEYVFNRVQLPSITCDRCVFRWVYKAGNSWGVCDDGTGALGCGAQEHFLSCSDITIAAANSAKTTENENSAETTDKANSSKTTDSSDSAKTTESENSAKTTEKANSPKTTESADSAKTTESENSAKTTEKANSPKTTESADSVKTTESENSAKTTEKANSPETTESADSVKTTESENSAKTTEKANSPKTTESADSAKTTKSENSAKTTEKTNLPKTTKRDDSA